MPNDKAQKLKEIMNLLTDSLTRKDFEAAFAQVVEYVKKNGKQTEEDVKTLTQAVNSAISRIESTASENYAKTSEKLTGEAEKALNDVQFKVEALIAECQAKMDEMHDGEDGEDADEDEIVEKVLALIPEHKEESAEETRDLLETLTGEERLKIDAINNLREELDRLEKEIKKGGTIIGGARGVGVLDEGQTVALSAQWLNFTGAGVSVSNVGNQTVIQITGGGVGSTTPIQDSGSITDLTTIVTLAHTPYADTLMLYINEAFVDPSRYSVNGSNAIVMGTPLDASYTGLRYTAIYQYA